MQSRSAWSAPMETRLFPDWFTTPFETLSNYAGLERSDLPMDYYHTLREAIAAVTKDDVMRVAAEHIRPDRFLIITAGDAATIQAGNEAYAPRIADFGAVEVTEPGDPMEAN